MLKTPHLKYQPVYLNLRTLVLDPVPNFNTPPFGGGVDSCYLQVKYLRNTLSLLYGPSRVKASLIFIYILFKFIFAVYCSSTSSNSTLCI